MSSETRIPLHKLNQPCSQLLERVVLWLLGLSTTQQAIAEIIDNMPISSHFFGRHNICDQPHPEIQRRLKPSDRAVKLASELCETLDPRTLPVDAQVSFLSHTGRVWTCRASSLIAGRNLTDCKKL